MGAKEEIEGAGEAQSANALGSFIRKARTDVSMTLRDVEEATQKEVSNGYLSQLESGKITRPSPHILYALASALSVDYETLMQRAGYILPGRARTPTSKHGRAATFAINNLSSDEESELLKYLDFLRSRKK